MKRIGQVIGLRAEHFREYKNKYEAVWLEIGEKIKDITLLLLVAMFLIGCIKVEEKSAMDDYTSNSQVY